MDLDYRNARLLRNLRGAATINVTLVQDFEARLQRDVDALHDLACRGLLTCKASVDFGKLSASQRSKLIKALKDGLYLGSRGRGAQLYKKLATIAGVGHCLLERSYTGWYLTSDGLPEGTLRALHDFNYCDRVAHAMENNLAPPPVTEFNLYRCSGGWMLRSKANRIKPNSLLELLRPVTSKASYIKRVTPIIEAIKAKTTMELT